MVEAIIDITDLKFQWTKDKSFSFSIPKLLIEKGESVLLLGESGSGKTTLLSLIGGFIPPINGNINIKETNIGFLSAKQRDQFRADHIGVIFQQFNLLSYAKVIDNILLPLHFSKQRSQNVKNPITAAENLCSTLRLPDRIKSMQAKNLSVGQQQRVAVARALIGDPALIIADEPTSSLDASAREIFMELMFLQIRRSASTLLMVSHDQSLANKFDRVININEILIREY